MRRLYFFILVVSTFFYPFSSLYSQGGGRSGDDTWEKVSIGSVKKIDVNGGAYCSGINWCNASDKILKERFIDINGEENLKKIAQMDINQWNYKTVDETIKHVVPLAKEFYTLFELGNACRN